VIEITPLTNKELCTLAFECEPQTDFPALSWNVTFPARPKPTPRPPQPPSVSSRSLRISFHHMTYASAHSRLAHPRSPYSISPISTSTSPTSPDHKQTALSRSAVEPVNPVLMRPFFLFSFILSRLSVLAPGHIGAGFW
jgi:hypothetical protein